MHAPRVLARSPVARIAFGSEAKEASVPFVVSRLRMTRAMRTTFASWADAACPACITLAAIRKP